MAALLTPRKGLLLLVIRAFRRRGLYYNLSVASRLTKPVNF